MPRGAEAALWLKRRWVSLGLVLLAAGLLFGNSGFRRLVRQTLFLRGLNREIARLQIEENELRRKVGSADKDDRALEKAAREVIDYRRKDEYVYIFEPPKKKKKR
jgi:cell division protein FtsB